MTDQTAENLAIEHLIKLNFAAAKGIIEENNLWGKIDRIAKNVIQYRKSGDERPVYFLYYLQLGLPPYLSPVEQIREMVHYWKFLRRMAELKLDRLANPLFYWLYRQFNPPNY